MYRTIDVLNIHRECISRLLIFTILIRNVKLFNGVTVDGSLVSINNRVVTVDLDSLSVMRNGKREDLSIKFVLLEYLTVQIDYLFNSNTRAMSVSSICNIKPFIPTFYFHRKIRKVYLG